MRASGGWVGRRPRDAGSHPPVSEHPTEIQRGKHGRVFEREIGDPDSPGVSGADLEFHRTAFLGERVPREYRRLGRADDPSVHP